MRPIIFVIFVFLVVNSLISLIVVAACRSCFVAVNFSRFAFFVCFVGGTWFCPAPMPRLCLNRAG